MELEELASCFKKVRLNGRGFSASCPAHPDSNPSLTVARGATSWLVSCHAGCSFLDIAAAAGLKPLSFKFGGSSSSGSATSSLDARRKLREMMAQRRRIPVTIEEVADIALSPEPRRFADATIRHLTMARTPFMVAMKMHIVLMDGFIWSLVEHDWRDYGTDWVEAKRKIARLLWETWVAEGGAR